MRDSNTSKKVMRAISFTIFLRCGISLYKKNFTSIYSHKTYIHLEIIYIVYMFSIALYNLPRYAAYAGLETYWAWNFFPRHIDNNITWRIFLGIYSCTVQARNNIILWKKENWLFIRFKYLCNILITMHKTS